MKNILHTIFGHKLTALLGISAIAFSISACSSGQTALAGQNTVTTGAADNLPADESASDKMYRAEFKTEPSLLEAGRETVLVFNVKNTQGAIVRDLQIVHEKPIHLLIVSKDLAEFYHIHPEPQADGSYRVAHTFPYGGEYRLYADFTPKDARQVVEQIDVRVAGAERAGVPLEADRNFEKTVEGLKVVLKPDAEIKAGQELMLNFQVFDAASGKPATDLQNYLGELAHFVIISEDMKDFVHAHPMSKSEHKAMQGGDHKSDGHKHGDEKAESKTVRAAEVAAHTAFPRGGLYKVWAQFQRGGKVITVPFTVNSADSDRKTQIKTANIPVGAIKITVSGEGFEPAQIPVKKGETVKLAFYRADAENCGGAVVFPKLDITKKLPVGETVLVEITPTDSGELAFACGMGMYKGSLVVSE